LQLIYAIFANKDATKHTLIECKFITECPNFFIILYVTVVIVRTRLSRTRS